MSILGRAKDVFRAAPEYQPALRRAGIDVHTVFSDPRIVVWRSLEDRQNCTLDVEMDDGPLRLHIKRYFPQRYGKPTADVEAQGIQALRVEGIATAPLVGWGTLLDGRSFLITADLAGFRDSEKLVEAGTPFETLLGPTADLAAKLHSSGLHHRDLYLCHFFARVEGGTAELRLIDAARVKRLPGILTRRRWIVKDLAQFWYSTQRLAVTEDQRLGWLERYLSRRGLGGSARWIKSVKRKAAWIGRHDERLRRSQPGRNVSLGDSAP